jgi:alpha-beta hydrolase superfamily lysophospholipase
MKTFIIAVGSGIIALVIVAALSITLGGPGTPLPMKSINDPCKAADYSDLPPLSHYSARDGSVLAFRYYQRVDGTARGSVVLLHGSSASSRSMHSMAEAFSASGYAAYALDVRGHGDSGVRGDIAYVGQLEDDLEDFAHAVKPLAPATLVGFSSGGGFALRVAGSSRQRLFANYLLLSPFISQDAPTYRPRSGGWISVGLPRYIAIAVMDRFGIHAFDHLPVVRYALNDEAKKFLTPVYSFALAENYRPERDYKATILAVRRPLRVLAGENDEVFYSDRFGAVFRAEGKNVPVELIPGVNHIGVSLDPKALRAAVEAVNQLDGSDQMHRSEGAPN